MLLISNSYYNDKYGAYTQRGLNHAILLAQQLVEQYGYPYSIININLDNGETVELGYVDQSGEWCAFLEPVDPYEVF